MNIQTILEQAPSWAKVIGGACMSGCIAVGGWVATIELRLDHGLTETEFYEYMNDYRLEQKQDFQRLEDKIDKKADKP